MCPVKVSDEFALKDAEWQLEYLKSYDKAGKEKQVEACLVLIDKYLKTKLKGMQTCRRSYGLKHDFERIAKIYICNGAAVKAMVLSGFTPYRDQRLRESTKEKPMHIYYFNFSRKEWNELEKESQRMWANK
jgi:hypothetical protein